MIQNRAQARNVDSKKPPPRFDCFKFQFHSIWSVTFATVSLRKRPSAIKMRICREVPNSDIQSGAAGSRRNGNWRRPSEEFPYLEPSTKTPPVVTFRWGFAF